MNNRHILAKFILTGLIFMQVTCMGQSEKTQNKAFENFRFQEQDITQIQQGYKDGRFTCKELVQAYLGRIAAIDKNGPHLNSIIEINPDAIKIAEGLDREIGRASCRER